jgi:hypothetical protein
MSNKENAGWVDALRMTIENGHSRRWHWSVHHQIIWDQIGIVLTEDWPHLIVDDYAAALR